MKSRRVHPNTPVLPLAIVLGLLAAVMLQAADPERPNEKDRGKLRLGTVTAGTLNVRARPAKHFERIGKFSRGDRVTIVSENENWFEVRVPKKTRAWIAARFVDDKGLITSNTLRIHSGPGLVFTTFGQLHKGDKVSIVGLPVDGWVQIEVPETTTAWVNKAYVRVDEPEPPKPEPEVAAATEQTDTKANKTKPPQPEKPAATAAEQPKTIAGTAKEKAADIELPSKDWKKVTLLPREEKKTEQKDNRTPTENKAATQAAAAAEKAPGKTAGKNPAATQKKAETAQPEAAGENAETTEKTEVVVTKEAAQPTAAEGKEPPREQKAAKPEITQNKAETETTETTPPGETEEEKAEEALKKGASPLVMREGLLLSLKDQASPQATHVLCLRVHYTAFPLCYLRSKKIDLKEWERREVRVYGRQFLYENWEKPVIEVTGIQLKPKE